MHKSFDAFSSYLRKASGLVIDADKKYLVESRILPIIRREKLGGLAELVEALERGRSSKLAREVVQAMTINETYFFRDKSPFEAFAKTILPRLLVANAERRTLRIWSAACSTGQEPYSLAMILDEQTRALKDWRIEILATDLAEHVLERAREAIYSQFEVQRGLAPDQLRRHFTPVGANWQLRPEIRSMVTFRAFNLLSDFMPLGQFDFILCRNVLIYFDAAQKADVIRRLTRVLSPDGLLLLGASEGMLGNSDDLVAETAVRGGYRHAPAEARRPAPASPQLRPRAPSAIDIKLARQA